MSEYIEREKVYEMLNDLGGCGAEPESWDDGWDKAINAAIKGLEKIPALGSENGKRMYKSMSAVKLKSCPFCGGNAILHQPDIQGLNWVAECRRCRCTSPWCGEKSMAAEKWNTRSDKN